MPLRPRAALAALATAWVSLVAAGLLTVARHDAAAGTAGQAPRSWPTASHVTRDPSRPTLVMLLHPECSCSNASITELERLMARQSSRLAVRVLMVAPPGLATDPQASSKWARLEHIPGVTPLVDTGGREALLFGAHTSGQVVFYDARGALAFQGGITASRAHEGDNDGITAIDDLLDGVEARAATPVYGCGLFHEGAS